MTGDTNRDAEDEPAVGRSRALVVPASDPSEGPAVRPLPAFLAQLIACDRRLPEYRRARREAPGAARSAYSAGAEQPAPGLDVTI